LGCPPVSVRNEPERAALFFATAAVSTTKTDAGLAITARMHILAARTLGGFPLFVFTSSKHSTDMALEKTLVLLKPCTVQRALMGEVLARFEKKGLRVCGLKMMQLDDALLSEHYAHLSGKEFFQRVKDSMMVCPVVAIALEGVGAVEAVRTITGPTTGRKAPAGTIRGDFSMSFQENIVHASDSLEAAEVELKRFFRDEELFDYRLSVFDSLYANDEF
jgi:nucleoside diphosphate kinase